ncbi:MAG TPA: ferrous iron transport protein A [Clostridiales bacterium]|nr:ferrous iron transport protein A [Clostridiales bacterium]
MLKSPLPLSAATINKQYYICKIALKRKYAAKLFKLGVSKGEEVKIERIFGKSAYVIETGGAKIAIGRDIAQKIFVIEENHGGKN